MFRPHMTWRHPSEKPLSELSPKKITLDDIGYAVNTVMSYGIRLGGLAHAIHPLPMIGSDNHVRDGLLLYAAGAVIGMAHSASLYVREIYRNTQD